MRVRDMRPEDLEEVELIYRASSGEVETELHLRRVEALLEQPLRGVALVAQKGSEPVVGYLLGEIRTWEFGSSRAGWIFALGVDPLYKSQGVSKMLLERARIRFEELRVEVVRTLIHQDEIATGAQFEEAGFRKGPFVALELDLGGKSS